MCGLWFYFKDETTDFDVHIVGNNDFKSLKYNAEFLGNTEGQRANGILKSTTIAAPLKYLSSFWRSLEMPLINCKVELKLKWKNLGALSADGNDMMILMVFRLK